MCPCLTFMRYPGKETCTHRAFHPVHGGIDTNSFTGFLYAIETGLHEMLAQSRHRTLDPLEADFFYVPVYASCFAWPIFGWADTPWCGHSHTYFIGSFKNSNSDQNSSQC